MTANPAGKANPKSANLSTRSPLSPPWFRLYHEFAGDPNVQSLSFEDQRHLVVLWCLKAQGVIDRDYPSDDRRDAVVARGLSVNIIEARAIHARLDEAGLLLKGWQPKGWETRQYQSDSAKDRMRKYRARRNNAVTVTAQDSDTDTEKEEKTAAAPPRGYAAVTDPKARNERLAPILLEYPSLGPVTRKAAMSAVHKWAATAGRWAGMEALESAFRVVLGAFAADEGRGTIANRHAYAARLLEHYAQAWAATKATEAHEVVKRADRPAPLPFDAHLRAALGRGLEYDDACREATRLVAHQDRLAALLESGSGTR